MRIDLPLCDFINCRYRFDGNCKDGNEYNRCQYRRLKEQVSKTGEWKPFDLTFGRSIYYCTVCQKSAEGNLFNYCPNCGAKMESEE